MNIKSKFWKLSIVTLAGVLLAALSCGHPTGSGGCTGAAGTHLCACLSGSTCNDGLTCAIDKNVCVTVTSGAAGTNGAAGTATSGEAGTNGAAGTATTGEAGTNGAAGTNGSAGTNGAAGTNGDAGTSGGGGSNLIINGDFSNGMTDWAIPNGTPTNPGVTGGQFCLTLATNNNVILGWGDTSTSAVVNTGTNYTLSYQAKSTSALSMFEVHLGQVVSPYNVDYNDNTDAPSTGLTTFTHNFTVNTSDSQAGLAFVMTATTGTPTVCIDNVSLRSN